MKTFRVVLAAPFGLVSFALMFLATVFAKAAMAIAGMGGKGPMKVTVRL